MSHECANKHAPPSFGMPDRSEEHMILPLQTSCPTSSVSLWTRRRPSSRSTPSPRCRFEASVWIQPEVYNLANPLITTRSSHRARPAPLFTVSLQERKPGQSRGWWVIWCDGPTLFFYFQIWLSSRTKHMQPVSFLSIFVCVFIYFLCFIFSYWNADRKRLSGRNNRVHYLCGVFI